MGYNVDLRNWNILMRAEVIDIGSNSTKLVIGEDDGKNLRIIDSLKNVNAIGRSTFYKGRIAQDIFYEVISVLNKYKEVIKDPKSSLKMLIFPDLAQNFRLGLTKLTLFS